MPGTSPLWLEISLDRVGDEVRVSARGSQGQRTAIRPLGGGLDVPALRGYAASVREAARRGQSLSPELLSQTRAIDRALLEGEVGELHSELRGRLDKAAAGRLVVRLVVHDDELKAVPWEAACKPGEALGFWGSAPDRLPVRGVVSLEPWLSREVRGAVRVLAVAPAGGAALATLHDALADPIAAGEIEWLEPVGGARAQVKYLFDRLRREPLPHVLHFLGHGGIDSKGRPVLRFADNDDDEEKWLPVELLAQQLEAHLLGVLRLVVLEACEGARPSAFASAAEILARKGVDAVLAHLWPVKAEMARICSRELYGALAGAHPGSGDVALALNEARRVMLAEFDTSAEAFSPVLYLRAPDGKLFDFEGRRVARPPIVAPALAAADALDPDFVRLLRGILREPFSLVLGDRLKDERPMLTGFRQKLHEGLAEDFDPAPEGLSMGALAQRFEFRRSPDDLAGVFQETFGNGAAAPAIVAALSRWLGPGLHTTLLRTPWLEQSLAEAQPDQTIQVIYPRGEGVRVMRRVGGGGTSWQDNAPLKEVDIAKDIVLLRPYRGYNLNGVFSRPLLAEDDYYQMGLQALLSKLPPELSDVALSLLSYRPALLAGVSLFTAHHRRLLHSLYPRGLQLGSLVVLEPGETERTLWEKGTGLPGKGGIKAIESASAALIEALRAVPEGGGR